MFPAVFALSKEQLGEVVTQGIALIALVLVLAFIYRATRRGISALERREHLKPTMARRLTISIRWVLTTVAILAILQQTGVFKQAWAVLSATLAAVALGFVAMWSVLSNMVCALMLLVYRPFRIGDHVTVYPATGTEHPLGGKVLDLTLMYTTLEQSADEDEHCLIRVPNNLFFQNMIACKVKRSPSATTTFFGTEPNDSE